MARWVWRSPARTWVVAIACWLAGVVSPFRGFFLTKKGLPFGQWASNIGLMSAAVISGPVGAGARCSEIVTRSGGWLGPLLWTPSGISPTRTRVRMFFTSMRVLSPGVPDWR